jgi:uroporphyrinogen-III decarboxylase
MNSRERVRKVLNHQQGDKVPMDFGATAVTGMHVQCIEGLREHFGLEKRAVKVCDPYQMLGVIEDDLLDAIGVDVVGIDPRGNMLGYENNNWKSWNTPWGQEVLMGGDFVYDERENDILVYPGGDKSVPASGRMSKATYFFDTIIRQKPIDDNNLNPEDNLEEFGPMSDEDIAHFTKEIAEKAKGERAIIANLGGTAFGDIALVPGPFLKHPKGIRDVAEWYMSTAIRQDYIHEVFGKQSEIAVENLKKFYEIMGERIEAIFICGTDFGTQSGTFCSGDTFDSLYGPYYKKVNGWVHENTGWKTFKHSCGAVESFMSHFIDVGFDIINPVQCSATGMEPEGLKDKYGDKLTFWGGGVDTQNTLPFGTVSEVREEVLQRCDIFSKDGGFVFNAIHNVQANVPLENIIAMIEAVKEFNGEK